MTDPTDAPPQSRPSIRYRAFERGPAHSFLPEFESQLSKSGRLKVSTFAKKLSGFFSDQWNQVMPANYAGSSMIFLIGGYDPGKPYGVVYEVQIPGKPNPFEQKKGQFGIIWGGQLGITSRILNGYDPSLIGIVKDELGVSATKLKDLEKRFGQLGIKIPYQFLPLQDCVDLSIFLVRATSSLQSWQVELRGVGGAIDVATITRPEGFKYVQQKGIEGEG